MPNEKRELKNPDTMQFKAHPWHGVQLGEHYPEIVTAYIEIVPNDTVKYELDKDSGILKIDRPQAYSNIYPTLYGMLPQTYCSQKIAEYCSKKTGLIGISGDNDPLDICVMTEKIVPHGDILLRARPIGGLRLLDRGEADDKIIAVLVGDALYGNYKELTELPESVIRRLEHFFLTYKQMPGETENFCNLESIYSCAEAHDVIRLAHEDYLALIAHRII